jgi:hypothetical protein
MRSFCLSFSLEQKHIAAIAPKRQLRHRKSLVQGVQKLENQPPFPTIQAI